MTSKIEEILNKIGDGKIKINEGEPFVIYYLRRPPMFESSECADIGFYRL